MSRLMPLLLLLASLTATLTAEETVPADSIRVQYRMDPVVVTATKIRHARRDLAASISEIPRELIETTPTAAVLELIQHHVPGLYVTEWGVMGFGAAGQAAGKISIRGMGGGADTHVLILRNGRPDFMGLMGCTIADEFSSDGVERVEVIRGPGSFLYGTNATGGIINIIPRQVHENGFETTFKASAGSFNIRTLSLSHGGRQGAFDYYLTANTRRTDGHRDDSAYRGDHYTLHGGYRFNNSILEFNANLADLRVLDPGPVNAPRTDNWYDMLRFGGDLNWIQNSAWGESNIKLHANFGEHQFFSGWNSTDRTLGLMFFHNAKPWKGQTFTAGFDFKRYGGRADDASTDYGEFFITEYAPYLHAQQLLGSRLIVSAGFRVENHELYGREWLPKAGIVVHPDRATSLRFSLAKGFRSPSIRELYFWAPANEELTPDRTWNLEAGLSRVFGRRLRLEAAVFETRGRNLIQFSGPPPRWVNGGSYEHRGYELVFNWMARDRVEIGATWSHMDLSESAYNIPGRKLTCYASAGWRFLSASVHLLMIQDMKGAEFGPSPVPVLHEMDDFTLVNLTLSADILRRLRLNLSAKNMLNTSYEAMWGYPMPGRHLMLEMESRW